MGAVQRAAIERHYTRSLGEEKARESAAKVDAAGVRRGVEAGMAIVAEETGALLGFAEFNGATGEIDLCCRPDAEQRAIPAALLAVIETEARSRGLDTLSLRAMPETESLYAASGFAAVQPLPAAGDSLPRIRLEKRLVYSEPRPERRRNGGGNPVPTLT